LVAEGRFPSSAGGSSRLGMSVDLRKCTGAVMDGCSVPLPEVAMVARRWLRVETSEGAPRRCCRARGGGALHSKSEAGGTKSQIHFFAGHWGARMCRVC